MRSVRPARGRALFKLVIATTSILALLVFGGAAAAPARGLGDGNVLCSGHLAPSVVVDTETHTLALCANRTAERAFAVRLGKRGVGKEREGDGKTPLGRYTLGTPRSSGAYGTFIPVGYPTEEQRRRGMTGGAIGVHGPDRRVRGLGALVNAFDTTDGCIGIATDDEMQVIERWVGQRRAGEIVVR